MDNPQADHLLKIFNDRSAVVGIIGLGYVGLPLALAFTEKGFNVLGFDTDPVICASSADHLLEKSKAVAPPGNAG